MIIMEWIQNYGIGLAILGILGLALKKIPSMIESKVISALDKMFEKGGPAEDKLLVALIDYAEFRYGPGSGAVKAKYCVDKIMAMLPLTYRVFATQNVQDRAQQLLQACFDKTMDSVAKAAMERR